MADPRRLNWVTFLMLLAGAGAGYWLWKFFPVYYTGWQVDHKLSEAGAETYQIARLPDPVRGERKAEIERQLRDKITALGVDDPELAVRIDLDGKTAAAYADYQVVVQHPIGNKQTVIVMHRQAVTDVKRIEW